MAEWLVRLDPSTDHLGESCQLTALPPMQLLDLLQHALVVLERRELESGPWPSDMHMGLQMAVIGVNKLEASLRGQLELAAEVHRRMGEAS